MDKFKELMEIDAGLRCPVCKHDHVKQVASTKKSVSFECKDCRSTWYSPMLNGYKLMTTFLTVLFAEALYLLVLVKTKIPRVVIIILFVILIIVMRELVSYLGYILFKKTGMKVTYNSQTGEHKK